MGQWEFGRQFNMAIDLTDRPGGDGRINFITDIGTLSVSTAQKPNNLLREVGKECARYHVLAKFSAKNQDSYWYRHSSVRLIGWESDEVMLQQPTRDFGHGIVSHYLLARELRPIIELRYLLLGEGIQARLI
jgi:hypothetical protein